MRVFSLFLILLIPCLSFGDNQNPENLQQVKKLQSYYRSEFFKVSGRVQRSEPTLYRSEFNEGFPEYQNWVFKHQRFITKHQIQLRLLLHKPGRHLKINRDVSPLFEKFHEVYKDFLVEFPINSRDHLSMFTDDDYKEEFKVKLITALTEMTYSKSLGIDVPLPYFNSETCDYFAPSFNAVWFSLHGMLLIDQYLTLINPNEWEVYKVENGISLDEERIDDDLGELIRKLHYLEI